jgi:outer membrane protein W
MVPDKDAFNDAGYDSDLLVGGVLEFDSNLGLTVETSLEYFSQSGDDGKVTIFPFLLSAKYNFFPRYRTTPFVGVGIGTYFIEEEEGKNSTTKTQFGVRVGGGVRFLEDRRMNFIIEAARNFVDFKSTNASSFQVTASVIFDFYPTIVGVP